MFNVKIDRDILFVALYRIFQVGSVGLTSIFIPLFVNEVEQGIYFIFLNLVAAQLLFELGLNQAVLQVSSHVIDRKSISYHSLIAWLEVTYKKIALKFYLSISLVGVIYFYLFTPSEYYYVIYLWLFIAFFVSVGLSIMYRYALMESETKVAHSYRGKFLPLFLSTMCLWLMLFLKCGLISIVIGYMIQSFVTYAWLKKNYPVEKQELKLFEKNNIYISEVKEIKNKFALSYIGGYIGFNSVVPAVFALVSPAEAGRVGLSLAMFSAVTLVSSSFVTAKNVSMANLISTRSYQELNKGFFKYFWLSIVASVCFVLSIFALIALMTELGYNFSARLMDVKMLIAIALAACANTAIYAMAIYVRSHKVEPFVAASVVSASVTFFLSIVGAIYSARWSVSGYVVSVLLISIPWTIVIFKRYYHYNVKY